MCGHCCDFTILLNDVGKLESLQKDGGPGRRFPQTAGCKSRACFVNSVKTVVPNRGFSNPRGPKQDFQGSEMRFFRVRVCMSLHEHFFKRTDIYENLQVLLLKKYTLSSLIIPKYY